MERELKKPKVCSKYCVWLYKAGNEYSGDIYYCMYPQATSVGRSAKNQEELFKNCPLKEEMENAYLC